MDAVRQRLALAGRSLEYVERTARRPHLAAELAALGRKIEAGGAGEDLAALLGEICELRRRIIFSHPDLDFEDLLINLQPQPGFSHMCFQYLGRHQAPGRGLAVVENWKTAPRLRLLLADRMPPGAYRHPDLSFDGRRILFAFSDHREPDPELRRFWIWECAADGAWVRQLTGTRSDPLRVWGGRQTVLIEDWDPCYLPGGGFVFVSTRCQTFGRCHGESYAPVYLLHRADADGGHIRQISFAEANEWNPSILDDGRVLYTRWDYINRHDTLLQGLWTTRPDGTDTRHFYGTNTRAPTMLAEARVIPGSRLVVATAAAHHLYTTGSLVTIDRLEGEDGQRPITRITPEAAWPEAEGYDRPGSYGSPWPVNEELFLAAYQPDLISRGRRDRRVNHHAVYLVDTLGGRELIYRDPEISCVSPIPLRPRPAPPALESSLAAGSGKGSRQEGTLFIQDVHRSVVDFEPGTIRSLRVNRIHGQPTNIKLNPGVATNEVIKEILGTVPVEEDGSVMFDVPAGQPLQLQALDENGMALMTMRSLIYVQPGETVSCIGCHEPRGMSPPNRASFATRRPVKIIPPAGPSYRGGFSFVRTVQPVLDRYCIGCHGLERTDGNIDLLGTPRVVTVPRCRRNTGEIVWNGKIFASQAVASLLSREMFEKELVSVALRFGETDVSRPRDYFAHAGKLAPMLLEGHGGVKLDRESLQRIIDWLDLNAQVSGSYSHNRLEFRTPSPDGEGALRAHVRKTFGEELASQPLAALINWALPAESRILRAPLAVETGGWGQIEGGWESTADPGYREMLRLVEGVLTPLEHGDLHGTCGRPECVCGACWVRRARARYVAERGSE